MVWTFIQLQFLWFGAGELGGCIKFQLGCTAFPLHPVKWAPWTAATGFISGIHVYPNGSLAQAEWLIHSRYGSRSTYANHCSHRSAAPSTGRNRNLFLAGLSPTQTEPLLPIKYAVACAGRQCLSPFLNVLSRLARRGFSFSMKTQAFSFFLFLCNG